MTGDTTALARCWRKRSDATLLREMIGFAAQRLMELEIETLTGMVHGERGEGRRVQRNGRRERDWETWATRAGLRGVARPRPVGPPWGRPRMGLHAGSAPDAPVF